ncbi:MAG: hypothetical protein LBL46_03785 [Rickettsiales bacterium]|jgi:hypothetical protein|nr:hypothetical protein [Rickettsiales bacterium]
MKKILALLVLTGCLQQTGEQGSAYNGDDFAAGGPDAPEMNERTMAFMQPGNQYANVESFRPKTEAQKQDTTTKWDTSKKITRWQEYKGQMVRVEILLGSQDLREMRLKLNQSADGGDIDGDMREIIAKVADFEMKKVCGRRASNIVVVYDNASFDTLRPTPFFDYKVGADGSSMREYGFRCVYN